MNLWKNNHLNFGYFQGIFFGVLIFSAVFGGVLSHLLKDMNAGLNRNGSPWELEPLQPFSDRSIGYGIYKAPDESVNGAFSKVGGDRLLFLYFNFNGST